MTDGTDGEGSSSTAGVLARLRELASFIAPTTVATSLLFYFGYVATRSRFEYFGVYLEMTDLSNQNLLLYGLEVVYVPAALAFLATLLLVAVHGTVRWLVSTARRDSVNAAIALAAALGGLLLIGRALVGILVPRVEATEPIPGTTALTLAAGPALMGYAAWIASRIATRAAGAGDASGPVRFAAWCAGDSATRLRRSALGCIIALSVAGLFWAANEFAWAYGAGRAYDDALHMPERPAVILETKEPLTGLPDGITATLLPDGGTAETATFCCRYDNMRLLLASGGRLFLVPQDWTATSRTVVVPYDSDVRIQLMPTR